MALTVLGAFAVAILAACVAFILRRMTGLFPRWIIPAAAGASMLGFTVWNDYTWFGRTVSALPDTVLVTDRFGSRNAIQPWSLLVEPVSRFRAVDLGSLRRLSVQPDIRGVGVFLVARFTPTFVTPQILDCTRGARADADPATLDAQGLPPETAWVPVDPANPLLRAVCDAPLR